MKSSTLIASSAIASLLALGLTASGEALAQKGANEKCSGIVKASKNDCGTSTASCAGTSKADNDKEAWIYLPKGACERITGGTVVTDKPMNKPGGAAKEKKG